MHNFVNESKRCVFCKGIHRANQCNVATRKILLREKAHCFFVSNEVILCVIVKFNCINVQFVMSSTEQPTVQLWILHCKGILALVLKFL